MVGKIKHVRHKLHQDAVKLSRSIDTQKQTSFKLETAPITLAPEVPGGSCFDFTKANREQLSVAIKEKTEGEQVIQRQLSSGIFAGTRISKEALVQTLKYEDGKDIAITPSLKGPEEKLTKKLLPKKEKMKKRREEWLSKMSSIKMAREQELAQAKRKTMPVVGDMRPLADALPELSQLVTSTGSAPTRKKNRKNKMPVKKKTEPTDFSLMKQSQKRKLLESETSRFSEAVKTLASKTNPLADIGEQLRKRMRQEEELGPS